MRQSFRAAALVLLAAAVPAAAADGTPAPAAAPSIERGSVINLQTAKGGAAPEEKGPFANRGGDMAPVLRALQAEGVKLTSLGEDAGIKSYLGEGANGLQQAFYVTPDGEHVVAGMLFAAGGDNVTTRQVARMMRRFGEAAKSAPGLDASSLTEIPEEPAAPAPAGQFVDWMKSNGLKMTPFLERTGGLDGYLVEAPSPTGGQGKLQPFYVFPGGTHAVAGVLVRRGGVFVTGLQIAALQQRFLADIEQGSAEKATQVAPGSPNPPPAPKPAETPPAVAALDALGGAPAPKPAEAVPAEALKAAATAAPAPVRAPATVQAPAGAGEMGAPDAAVLRPVPRPVAAETPPSRPSRDVAPVQPVLPDGPISTKPVSEAAPYLVQASDAKDFVEAAHSTVWFTAGVRGLPAVYMVADPQCPFCHQAWGRLKKLVFDRKIQVRVILIAGLRGSDPHVRSILARGEDAARAWLEGEGSIDGVQIKPPPAEGTPTNEEARRFMVVNGAFAERFKVSRTPFLFYTVPDGGLYASVGLPQDFDAFLAALR